MIQGLNLAKVFEGPVTAPGEKAESGSSSPLDGLLGVPEVEGGSENLGKESLRSMAGVHTASRKGISTETRSKVENLFKTFEEQYQISGKNLLFAMSIVPAQAWKDDPDQAVKMVVDQLPIQADLKAKAVQSYGDIVQDLAALQTYSAQGSAPGLVADKKDDESATFAGALAGGTSSDLAPESEPAAIAPKAPSPANSESYLRSQKVAESLRKLADGPAPGAKVVIPKDLAALTKAATGENPGAASVSETLREGPASTALAAMSAAAMSAAAKASDGEVAPKNSKLPTEVGVAAGLAVKQVLAEDQNGQEQPYEDSSTPYGQGPYREDSVKFGMKDVARSKTKTVGTSGAGKDIETMAVKKDFVMPDFFSDQKFNKSGELPTALAAPVFLENNTGENLTPQNLQAIINQTQYLIKKGGGEVQVQLHPAELGPIDLKVAILDGKVNLHFQTESLEVKKMIEKDLDEIRAKLSAKDLDLDRFRVDTPVDAIQTKGTETALTDGRGQDPSANRDQGQQQSPNRQAMQFWNQFNESFGNRGQREWIQEPPGRKTTEPRSPNAIQPLGKKNNDGGGTGSGNKGGGLNIVA